MSSPSTDLLVASARRAGIGLRVFREPLRGAPRVPKPLEVADAPRQGPTGPRSVVAGQALDGPVSLADALWNELCPTSRDTRVCAPATPSGPRREDGVRGRDEAACHTVAHVPRDRGHIGLSADRCELCDKARYAIVLEIALCRDHLYATTEFRLRPDEVVRLRRIHGDHPEISGIRYDGAGRRR